MSGLEWLVDPQLQHLPQFVTVLAIGLLIGLERERNPTAKAGLRTFALVALIGGLAQLLAERLDAPSIVAVGLAAVALAIVAAYYHHHEDIHERDPGTTTIAALIACYLLAALAMAGHARLAVILAVAATILLYFKSELSGVARGLERRDIISILQFAVVTFVVLPLLPNEDYGPYGAFNPRHVWLMVVLISALSLGGYVALRVAGSRGAYLAGLLGGLVSSTATTLSYSRLARDTPDATDAAAAAIVTANLVLPVRVMALAAVVAPGSLRTLAVPLGAGLAAAFAIHAAMWRGRTLDGGSVAVAVSNPVQLRTALGFAAFYAAVLLLVAWLADVAGGAGVYAVALVSGLTDVDAVTLSTLRMFGVGSLALPQVAMAIVIALSSNAAFKLALLRRVGGAAIFRRCYPPIVAMVLAALVAVVALKAA